MTDKPVLNTPGEMLVAARKAAGMDLDAVVTATKIPINILGHLERDEYHRISGPLYVNSFLRTYASEVGLEPSLVLEAYAQFSGERIGPSETPAGEPVWAEEEVEIKRVGLPWLQIGVASGVGLVLILAGVWFFGSRNEPEAPVQPTEMATDPGEPTSQAASEEVADESASAAASAEEIPPAGTGPATAGENDAAAATEPGAKPEARTEPPAPTRTPTNAVLPNADPGLPSLNFADGNRWPLVLRVVTTEPVGIDVVRDSERAASAAAWGGDPDRLPLLPTVGVEHGQPYRVREGYAVYWGARDQFSLRLDGTRNVEVELNGDSRDLSGLQPGQELILFVPGGRR